MKKDGIFIVFIVIISLIGISVIVNAQSSNIINLGSDVKDFFIEVAKGDVAGQISFNKFGENLNLGTTEEDIQSQGGTLTFLNVSQKINITSSSGSDTIAGVGARKIHIQGLDENFTEISEEVNLSGVSVSQTTKEYIRVYRMYVTEVGVYGGSNVGIITGTASINNSVQIEMVVNTGQSQTTHYTVPAGKRAIIKSFSITIDTGKIVTIELKVRELANNTVSSFAPTRYLQHWHGLDAPIIIESFANRNINEKTDVWFEGFVSTGSAEVEVNYDIILYDI